jgi:hypothetical protein
LEPTIGTVSSRSSWGDGREDQRDHEGVLTKAGLAGERPDTEEGQPATRVPRRPARSKRQRCTGGLPVTGRGGGRPDRRRDHHGGLAVVPWRPNATNRRRPVRA